MSDTPRTWFSGKSGPEDRKGLNPSTITVLVSLVLCPIGVVTALLGYFFAFNWAKLSWKVIAGTTGLYAAVWALFGGASADGLHAYSTPWRDLIASVRDNHFTATLADRWPAWLLAQAPLSLLLGGLGASAFSYYKWFRRPSWEPNDRVPGPLDVWRRRRILASIRSDTNGPNNGITLGYVEHGRKIVQLDAEAAGHTFVAGGTGAGKTTTMLIGIRDAIRRREPVIFIDLKGAADVPEQMAIWAARYGRKFLHWTIQNPRQPYHGPAEGPAFYDPIGRGDPSRRKDLLIGSQKWDVEYYKTVVENYLQIAFQIADLTSPEGVDSFTDIAELLNYEVLVQRARTLINASVLDPDGIMLLEERAPWDTLIPHVLDPELQALLDAVRHSTHGLDKNEQELSAIRNMRARLQILTRSTAGYWLKKSADHPERNIDLRRVVDEGWVVVVSLDSSNYEETSKQIGGLIIQDLKTLSSELRHDPAPTPLHVYVDEFSAIGSDNVLGLLARARDAKMPVTLSTQAIADLTRADPNFPKQVMGIIACFVIHRANMGEDAEIFAQLTGKHTVFRRQLGIEMTSGVAGGVGTGAATGTGFIREDEEERVKPSVFQDLKVGELVYIANAPVRRLEQAVRVQKEDPEAIAAAVAKGVVPAGAALPESSLAPAGTLGAARPALPNGMDAYAPAPRPAASGTAPQEAAPTPEPRAPRRPIVPEVDLNAPVQRPAEAPAAPQAVPAAPIEQAAAQPVAARPAVPLIDPAAFRSRSLPTPGGTTPQPATQVTRPPVPPRPVPRPVTPSTSPVRPGGLPVVRPAPLTAPWLTGDGASTDELGNPLPPAVSADDDAPSAFEVPATENPWTAPATPQDSAELTPPALVSAAVPAPDVPEPAATTEVSADDVAFQPPVGPARSTKATNVPINPKTSSGSTGAVIYDESEWT